MTVLGADRRIVDSGIISARKLELERRSNRLPASAFSPPDIEGLEGWWTGDSLGLANGDPVNSWSDLTGLATGTPFGTGPNPTFAASSINGHASLSTSATGMSMGLALPHRSPRNYVTFFLVARNRNGPGRVLGGDYAVLSSNWLIGFHGGHENVCYANGWIDASGGTGEDTTFLWRQFTLISEGDAVPKIFRGDGAVLGSSVSSTFDFTDRIILSGYGADSERVESDLAEIIVYARALTSAEVLQVETYLHGKYAL